VCIISFLLAFFTGIVDSTGEQKGYVKPEDSPPQTFLEVLRDIKEIFHLPALVWILVMVLFLFSTTYITILAVSANILHKSGLYLEPEQASLFVSIPSMVAIFGPAIFGQITDRFGRSLTWGLISCFLLVLGLIGFFIIDDRISINSSGYYNDYYWICV